MELQLFALMTLLRSERILAYQLHANHEELDLDNEHGKRLKELGSELSRRSHDCFRGMSLCAMFPVHRNLKPSNATVSNILKDCDASVKIFRIPLQFCVVARSGKSSRRIWGAPTSPLIM